ncbi:hypothetical protein P3L10_011509 [Capsicum annuum]
MDSVNQSNMGENDKQQISYENSSSENFCDSEWNDNLRVEAICIHHPECKWKIKASKMQKYKAFQVRTYDPVHTCKEWHYENRTITSSFIARKYLKEVGSNGNWRVAEFRDKINTK